MVIFPPVTPTWPARAAAARVTVLEDLAREGRVKKHPMKRGTMYSLAKKCAAAKERARL